MTQAKRPEALRIADELIALFGPTDIDERAAQELRRLHAENAALQQGYDAARLEIESLKTRMFALMTPAPAAHGDTERLDWLERQSHVNIERVRYLGTTKSIYEVAPYDSYTYEGDTLREAIDAAIAQAKEGANHDAR